MIEKIVEEAKSLYSDNLCAICLTGSCATNEQIDSWPDSDWDIVILLHKVTDAEKQKIAIIGEKLKLTDQYNLIPKEASLLANSTGLWKLIDKYHTKFLYGEDFKEKLTAPKHSDIARDNLQLLKKIKNRRDKWKYSTFKSDATFKKGLYWVLKRTITLFASSRYLETRQYLANRNELSKTNHNMDTIIKIINRYPSTTRDELTSVFPAIERVINYVETTSEKHLKH